MFGKNVDRASFIQQQELYQAKRAAFQDNAVFHWTFELDDGKNPMMKKARSYVTNWPQVRQDHISLLLWGDIGTGKSFFAGCIANALIEQHVVVRMTNFSRILDKVGTGYSEEKTRCLDELATCELLILDDFGMERGTEYALEQVFRVVDARVLSLLPMIVTTNLSIKALKEPEDLAHARIYDRILGYCAPIHFTGESHRKGEGVMALERAKQILSA